MRRIYIFIVVVMLGLSVPAVAEVKTAEAEKVENIRLLLKLVGAEKVQQNLADQFVDALKPLFAAMPQDDERTRRMLSRLSDLVIEEFRKIDFTTMTIELYDKYFSNDEIKSLIKFYESPLGRKATETLPALTEESFKRGMRQGEQASAKAIVRLTEEYPELKRTVPAVSEP